MNYTEHTHAPRCCNSLGELKPCAARPLEVSPPTRQLAITTEMRLLVRLTILLLAVLQRTAPAQASVQHPPSTASSRRSAVGGGLSLINGKTLVDTRVSDTSGWCHISLVQPLFSGIILLHMTLNGRGSRVVGAPRSPITAPTLLHAVHLRARNALCAPPPEVSSTTPYARARSA